MTLLGKIFTVLILVMSVLFMGFAVMVYATHTNWKMLVDNPTPSERYPELGLKQQIEQLREVNKQLRTERDEADQSLAMEQAARRFALAALQTKLGQAEQQRQASEAQLATLQAAHTAAVETERTTQNRLVQMTEEVNALRLQIRDALRDRDEQFATVVQKTDELNTSQGMIRDMQERQQQLQDDLGDQKKVLDAFGLTKDTPTDDRPPLGVVGEVLAVGDTDLVEISLGWDDGVRTGHRLDVFRDRSYLGKIKILKTSPDRAVAEILREYRKGLIRKGDEVAYLDLDLTGRFTTPVIANREG